jgi:hypothetical protein
LASITNTIPSMKKQLSNQFIWIPLIPTKELEILYQSINQKPTLSLLISTTSNNNNTEANSQQQHKEHPIRKVKGISEHRVTRWKGESSLRGLLVRMGR